ASVLIVWMAWGPGSAPPRCNTLADRLDRHLFVGWLIQVACGFVLGAQNRWTHRSPAGTTEPYGDSGMARDPPRAGSAASGCSICRSVMTERIQRDGRARREDPRTTAGLACALLHFALRKPEMGERRQDLGPRSSRGTAEG